MTEAQRAGQRDKVTRGPRASGNGLAAKVVRCAVRGAASDSRTADDNSTGTNLDLGGCKTTGGAGYPLGVKRRGDKGISMSEAGMRGGTPRRARSPVLNRACFYGIISVSLKGDADRNPANHEHNPFARRPVKFCFREQVPT